MTIKDNPKAPANIDLIINGQLWEEKSPGNATRSTVFENLVDAKGKWTRLGCNEPVRVVYSNIFGVRADDVVVSEVKSMIKELGIEEVLFLCNDGSILSLK